MEDKKLKSASKFLSLILRHQPQLIGLTLDENGWADVDELLDKIKEHGEDLSKGLLETIVVTNDKKRFAFNKDHSRIRASQGHSVGIDLALKPQSPPDILWHGTIKNFIPLIQQNGLVKMNRQHVHLSADEDTAKKVAGRRGKPVLLAIRAKEMSDKGCSFYLSENGVWLTDGVSPSFIIFPL
ncbi:MAG: RNA 2'-phosphotransferase [Ferruginibacter sp.]